jgi:hypothetical protein
MFSIYQNVDSRSEAVRVGLYHRITVGCAIAACFYSPTPAHAQPYCDDVAALNDEFGDAASLTEWTNETVVGEWPPQEVVLDINTTVSGVLYVEPEVSTWFQDYRGVLLYKEVAGNFSVTTRVQAMGLSSDVPTSTFSLAGVMIRAPRHESPGSWSAFQENWLFITTGAGDSPGIPQIETKNTVNSISALELTPGVVGWAELRIDRTGDLYRLYRRFKGEDWVQARTIVRDDLPATVQVGLIAYTDWSTVSGYPGTAESFNEVLVPSPPGSRDLIAEFDYVRFSRPIDGVVYDPTDYDHSSTIDLDDWRFLEQCLGGPGAEYADACCERADRDGDHDVDVADVVALLLAFGG